MRGNFVLLFPLFIFCLFNSYHYRSVNWVENCRDFSVSAETLATCYGSSNGSIALQIEGGSPPYQIKWSNGKTASRIQGLSEGTYSVVVTDSEECQWESSIHLKSFDVLNATVKEEAASGEQNNGSLEVLVSGGSPPYVYHWIGPTGIINKENTPKLSNLSKGKYLIAVTDDHRCSSVFKASVR